MNPMILDLASLIRETRAQTGRKCVLMLGAGASIGSGAKLTSAIMEELVSKYRQADTEGSISDRFDRLWRGSDADARDLYLKPYLELKPSAGYRHLADLIKREYFDTIVTFNFDQLMETALAESGCEHLVIVRGEYHADEKVRAAMESARPRVKILKMHGGLKGGDTLLFDRTEMHGYPDVINGLLQDLTRQQIIVCGYAFEDTCVLRAFSERGSSIFCVNPGGAPPKLQPILLKRKSDNWVFDKDWGRFDSFFEGLHKALTEDVTPRQRPKANPFKFLVSYDVRDKDRFHGRRKLIKEIAENLTMKRPKVFHLAGPSKAGKTSLVRAGIVANLDPELFLPIYARCQNPLETWLPTLIGRVLPSANSTEDIKTAINRLADSTKKHVVLVLDQFERVVNRYRDTEADQGQLLQCLNGLGNHALPNLTVLFVGEYSISYLKAIMKTKAEWIEVPRLERRKMGAIVRYQARKAGIHFEPAVIAALMKRYEETTTSNRPFSLAHVQAVCNLLASSTRVDVASYNEVIQNYSDVLDEVLNVCDIVSFVEDIPDEPGRNLFRKVMKVIPGESKKFLALYLKENFQDLFTPPEFVEILAAATEPRHG